MEIIKNSIFYTVLLFFSVEGCIEKRSEPVEEEKPSYRVFYPNINTTADGVLDLSLERMHHGSSLVNKVVNGDTLIIFDIQVDYKPEEKILTAQSWQIPVPSTLEELKKYLWEEYWVFIIGYGNLTDKNIEDAIALRNARTGEFFVGFYEREIIEDSIKASLTINYSYRNM
ncbi:MAG: hypothetical protein ACFCU6_13935 [Balneolaceae bacterium]